MGDFPGMKTIQRQYRVDRREISFVKFIAEAYEGLAGMTTIDPEMGILRFYIAPGCEREFDDLMADLGKEMIIEAKDYRLKAEGKSGNVVLPTP
jgi:hypothetical protein